jgi:hypothetical protein
LYRIDVSIPNEERGARPTTLLVLFQMIAPSATAFELQKKNELNTCDGGPTPDAPGIIGEGDLATLRFVAIFKHLSKIRTISEASNKKYMLDPDSTLMFLGEKVTY